MSRAAWVVSGDELYGIRTATLGMMEAARRVGVEPCVISLSEGTFSDELHRSAIESICLGLAEAPNYVGGLFAKIRGLAAMSVYKRGLARELEVALDRLRPDVVHLAWPHFTFMMGAVFHRRGLASFWEMPNIVGRTLPMDLNAKMFRMATRRWGIRPIANSQYTASTLARPGYEPAVVYPPTDTDRFSPRSERFELRRSMGFGKDDVVVGVVARLFDAKGQREVAQAVGLLASRFPELRLLLVGGPLDGEIAAEISSTAVAGGYRDKILLVDRVTDPRPYFGAMDLAVNARLDPEPFGLSVIEAMAMGLPVLAHALGGPAETVVDGQTGWLFKGVTATSVQTALEKALQERPRWQAMGCSARERAVERYSIEAASRSLRNVWKSR